MIKTSNSGLTIVLALAAALALSACTPKKTASLLNDPNGASSLDGSVAENGGLVPGSQAELAATAGDKVYFAQDASSLSSEAQNTLMQQAKWLAKNPDATIQIEGHADERGTREYNISLSARRATSVRNFLITQGVSGARIATIAYGKERPAATCDAEECWSQNRRAVTVVTRDGKTS